jgi:hypothetical protein
VLPEFLQGMTSMTTNPNNQHIKHDLFLRHPNCFMEAMQYAHHIQAKNNATHKSTIVAHTWRKDRFGVHKTNVPQLTRLTPQHMDERRANRLCFNCDNKYSKGHKCSKKKLFYIDCEEEEDQELEPPHDPDIKETTPTISCHTLADINTPQTLKIQGYIKNKKVTIFIDSGSTHNFINYKVAKDLNCFVYLAPKFQVTITDGGTINCSRKFHCIKLNMGDYFVSPMIAIQMGGADFVLGVQWLQS